MSWQERILSDQEIRQYFNGQAAENLAARVAALIEQQKQTWPMLRAGYAALAAVEARPAQVGESNIVIQHNPRRIRSTSAQVDTASVKARGCFLCPDSLPPEEKGIAYGDDLIMMCNPFPILDRHLTIMRREHVEQKIWGNVEALLELARDLSPDYFVLYNGPECGASAPDHLHFQACSRKLLPIEHDLGAEEAAPAAHCDVCADMPQDNFELFTLGDCGRSVIVYRGNKGGMLAQMIYNTLTELGRESGKPEPMVNIVSTYDKSGWTVYLFPRARHRPACFFAEGDERLTVSPGAIDMAGVIVVPEREHFEKIGPAEVEAIYAEVSLVVEMVDEIVERVCESSTV